MSDYDKSIHSSRDAVAWAKFFVETMNNHKDNDRLVDELVLDEGFMIGWFANAMMAMYDSMYNKEIAELKSQITTKEYAVDAMDASIGRLKSQLAKVTAIARELADVYGNPEHTYWVDRFNVDGKGMDIMKNVVQLSKLARAKQKELDEMEGKS